MGQGSVSCGVGHRGGLDVVLLWLWQRLAAVTLGMTPERCYQNPGSCSHRWRMNFTNTQAASKQSLYYRKANSSQGCWSWGWGRRAPTFYCPIGVFNPLKMGGYQHGVQKDVFFSHWPCPVTSIGPCPIGVLEVEMSHKFYDFFALLFL